jgi:hypothetical protein
MRAFLVLSAALVTVFGVYALPAGAELFLLRFHVNPWFVCVLFGDLFGCLILFLLGLRALAFGVYATSALVESLSLMWGIPPNRLIWMTNVLPAMTAGIVIVRIALRSLIQIDES